MQIHFISVKIRVERVATAFVEAESTMGFYGGLEEKETGYLSNGEPGALNTN